MHRSSCPFSPVVPVLLQVSGIRTPMKMKSVTLKTCNGTDNVVEL